MQVRADTYSIFSPKPDRKSFVRSVIRNKSSSNPPPRAPLSPVEIRGAKEFGEYTRKRWTREREWKIARDRKKHAYKNYSSDNIVPLCLSLSEFVQLSSDSDTHWYRTLNEIKMFLRPRRDGWYLSTGRWRF